MNKEKVVLAYSGGLDTSVILKWLEIEYNYDVIAVCVDVGQKDDFVAVKKKALETGAVKAYVIDVKEEFVKDYAFTTLKAGCIRRRLLAGNILRTPADRQETGGSG